jgi:hypothetical protein
MLLRAAAIAPNVLSVEVALLLLGLLSNIEAAIARS